MMQWHLTSSQLRELGLAISEFQTALPGWWWSLGNCSVSSHVSVGPDITGPDAHLLQQRLFDEGFHADLAHPTSPAEALRLVMQEATAARSDAIKRMTPRSGGEQGVGYVHAEPRNQLDAAQGAERRTPNSLLERN